MEQSTKKTSRQEFIKPHGMKLPTPPPDPTQHNINDHASAIQKKTMEKEKEFLEYLNSLPVPSMDSSNLQRTNSIFAPSIAAEDAFDHLERLYKVMEQLLNLKDQNTKLQRKIKDLERSRRLQKMHRQVASAVLRGEDTDIPELNEDYILTEDFLESMLSPSRSKKYTKTKPTQLKTSRNSSIIIENTTKLNEIESSIPRNNSRKYLLEKPGIKKTAKVSKWTKVKAAFKWEKASTTVTGAKSQDSGIGGMLPVNNEIARYLRVPSSSDNTNEQGISPADSVLNDSWHGHHETSTPRSLSPASSIDDIHTSIFAEHRSISRTGSAGTNAPDKCYGTLPMSDDEEGERRSRSLDYTSYPYDTNYPTKEDLSKLHMLKSHHKTPWSKMKDIIQTRKESLRKKQHRLSVKSDDYKIEWSAGSDQEDVFEPIKHENEDSKAPSVTITNTDELSSLQHKTYTNVDSEEKIHPLVLARYQNEDDKYQLKPNGSPRVQRKVSKWNKVKKAFLTSTKSDLDEPISVPASPTNKQSFFNDQNFNKEEQYNTPRRKISSDSQKTNKLEEEIYRNYEQLQKKLSQEFQEKIQEWEYVKSSNINNNLSTNIQSPSSGYSPCSEDPREFEFSRKSEEWDKTKCSNETKKKSIQPSSNDLRPDFKKKLQEWEKIKKQSIRQHNDDSSMKKKISDWQLWRSNPGQKHEILTQLGYPDNRQFSEDFLKKLDEWKQIKANKDVDKTNNDHEYKKSMKENKSPSPGLTRKDSAEKLLRQSKKYKVQEVKELQLLEKELLKIEREKQRLEREREKFLEREERLAKLRRSIGTNPDKKNVLVQTSTGFYRFEGISRKFTQRLYEWEKAKGIGPEASTIALLNTGYNENYPCLESNKNIHSDSVPKIKLQRSKSMDSIANTTFDGTTITHQPSSLSLNDMEDLEMQCMTESHSASEQNLIDSEEYLEDLPEPEAVIVEVEDFVEETASPLETHIAESLHYTPIYRTEVVNLCESEKCDAPLVHRSESARAMSNYNHIEKIISLLNEIKSSETEYWNCKTKESSSKNLDKNTDIKIDKSTGAIPKKSRDFENLHSEESLKNHLEKQMKLCNTLHKKIMFLQEENVLFTKNELEDTFSFSTTYSVTTIDKMQDLCTELVTISESFKTFLSKRITKFRNYDKNLNMKKMQEIIDYCESLISKVMELKRSLTYICAASDMTSPARKKLTTKGRKIPYHRSLSSEVTTNKHNNDNSSDEEDVCNIKYKYKTKLVKSKSEDNHYNITKLRLLGHNNPIKNTNTSHLHSSEKIISSELKDSTRTLKANESVKKKDIRKLQRTRRITDDFITYDIKSKTENEEEICNAIPLIDKNIVVETNTQYVDATSSDNLPTSPISVFVETTRKLFTPYVSDTVIVNEVPENNKNSYNEKIISVNETPSKEKIDDEIKYDNIIELNDDNTSNDFLLQNKLSEEIKPINTKLKNLEECSNKANIVSQEDSLNTTPITLPPLPNSPIFQRRDRNITKETSPAIRIMIARYNQKLSEQENPGYKSGGSSGSASPVAWRSPVLERRVKTQSEKYQEELNKSLLTNNANTINFEKKKVQKSASVGVMSAVKKQVTVPQMHEKNNHFSNKNPSPKIIRGILKSSSVDSLKKNTSILTKSNSSNMQYQSNLTENNTKIQAEIQKEIPVNIQDRAYKLQKAKEEFLQVSNNLSNTPSTSKQKDNNVTFPTKNRLSQISFGSESSCDETTYCRTLIKSASVGMINTDEIAYELNPEVHSQGYVSLPRSSKKKDGKFGISSITSKFRKVKMRKNKDNNQMNAVSALCRQSLIVDITSNVESNPENAEKKKEDESSTTKSSWLKNPSKIFKPK